MEFAIEDAWRILNDAGIFQWQICGDSVIDTLAPAIAKLVARLNDCRAENGMWRGRRSVHVILRKRRPSV
jgi:hypothetical protein